MINGKLTEFIDQLYYGQEIIFTYKGVKYFIQGWWNDDRSDAVMVLEEINDQLFTDYLWEYHAAKMSKCAEAFLSAPLWDDKDFLQIEAEVTWGDW